jgi:hypothetical protein
MVQVLVERNLSSLFPEYFGNTYEPYFRTPAGDVKPDLVLIRRDFKGWLLLEVEVEGHSPSAHILPQLTKLKFATSNQSLLEYFVGKFGEEHDPHLIEQALSFKPEVVLAMHGSSSSFQEKLKELGVTSLDLEIHTFPPDEYILEVIDYEENFVDTGLICFRSTNAATRFIWILPAISGLTASNGEGKIEINVDGSSSVWGIMSTKTDYLLRQPPDIQSLSGINKVSVYRHRNFDSLKFVPIKER